MTNTAQGSFEESLQQKLEQEGIARGIAVGGRSLNFKLADLIEGMSKEESIAVLVDNFDRPILNHLHTPEVAEQNRDVIRRFFTLLKSLNHIDLTLAMGTVHFSLNTIFSGPNHMQNVTMYKDYATLMGCTEEELLHNFQEHLQEVIQHRSKKGEPVDEQALLTEIRDWYGSYRLTEKEEYVYNTSSILRYLYNKKGGCYWKMYGCPAVLTKQLETHPEALPPLVGQGAGRDCLRMLHYVDRLDMKDFMFQYGYLTIKEYNPRADYANVGFPNREVQAAFVDWLIDQGAHMTHELVRECKEALEDRHTTLFFKKLQAIMAGFPRVLFIQANNPTYGFVFYSMLKKMNIDVSLDKGGNEDCTTLTIICPLQVYRIAIDSNAEKALDQLRERKCYQPYLNKRRDLIVLGLSFSEEPSLTISYQGEELDAGGHVIRSLEDKPEDKV